MPKLVTFSVHAVSVMAERDLEQAWIERVALAPRVDDARP